jgi:beta-mannosidase
VTSQVCTALESWDVCEVEAGAAADPDALDRRPVSWSRAQAPGTVASAMRARGAWALSTKRDFDAPDWWYRAQFACGDVGTGHAATLKLGGLATISDVWLNGTHLLRCENMFEEHAVDVSRLLRRSNDLTVRFSSLDAALAQRRPRPRFRTALVEDNQLRWFRTTLLGRMPGWTPPVCAVGPWRPVVLEEREGVSVEAADLWSSVEGGDGVLRVALRVRALGRIPASATLRVGESRCALSCRQVAVGLVSFEGELRVPGIALWWPASHGAQPRYQVSVVVCAGGREDVVECGSVGFRTVEVDTTDGGFGLRVNGEPVFCRGACWAPPDIARLGSPDETYAEVLDRAVDAGMNMIRVGGTMHYEQDAFYEACDARGLLVWHDFMFASLDYPATDASFCASVEREASAFLSRVQTCASLAVACGSSEVAQQAAMIGAPRDAWTNTLFDTTLPSIVRRIRPDLAYVPATPSGGSGLPFRVDVGVAHYYGVGAYMRPLDDARRSGVAFAAECLAFSNVPDEATIDLVLRPSESAVHHPAWKARVPRDNGSSWDFEDVRDHYTQLLFAVDPAHLRRDDLARYLAVSRVVTGEVMASALRDWRRAGSRCRGALVWTLQDLWPGAGFGLVDATGRPKAAYYFVRRTLQPVALLMTDEGLNGLALHAVNETPSPVDAEVEVRVYQRGESCVASRVASLSLSPRTSITLDAEAILDQFLDVTYAYRFGPPTRNLVVATLRERGSGRTLSTSFHFPMGHAFAVEPDLGVAATAAPGEGASYSLRVRSRRFAQAVAVIAPGYVPEDNYFHLEPGRERTIELRPSGSARALAGRVAPLNAVTSTAITLVDTHGEPSRG